MPHGYYSNCATTTTANVWYPNSYYPQTYYTTSAAITTVSPNVTWQQWVNNSTTSYQVTTYDNNQIWTRWTDQVWQTQYTPTVQSAEAVREANERYETQRRERRVAHARARVLLGEHLSEEQKVELERVGSFHVTGSKGRRYCIRTSGQSGNVDLLTDKGDVQATLCCHPSGGLPDGDAWLMQMIEIRHDEDRFLRVANVHRGRLPAELVPRM